MAELFGVDIQKEVFEGFNNGQDLRPVELTKVTAGQRTTGKLTAGTNPQTAVFNCRGFRDSLQSVRPGTLVEDASAVVNILGGSLPAGTIPEVNDRVSVDSGDSLLILAVGSDPADALYVCQVR